MPLTRSCYYFNLLHFNKSKICNRQFKISLANSHFKHHLRPLILFGMDIQLATQGLRSFAHIRKAVPAISAGYIETDAIIHNFERKPFVFNLDENVHTAAS